MLGVGLGSDEGFVITGEGVDEVPENKLGNGLGDDVNFVITGEGVDEVTDGPEMGTVEVEFRLRVGDATPFATLLVCLIRFA